SLLTPFGVTTTGTLNGIVTAPILNPSGPLTGPFTPVTPFTTSNPGFYNNEGVGQVLAQFGPGMAAIDFFASGALGPHSGAVVLFSDPDAMVAGNDLTTANLDLILNALALIEAPTPVPEPGTIAILAAGLVGLAFVRRR